MSIESIRGTNFADAYVATNFGVSGLNVGSFVSFNEFEGMGGNDSIVGNGNTRIAFYNALDGVAVDLSAGTSHGTVAGDVASVGTDTFTGVSAVAGSAFNDVITGSDNAANTAEEFAGRAGNDHIDGLGGFDRAFYSNDSSAVSGIHVDMALGGLEPTTLSSLRFSTLPLQATTRLAISFMGQTLSTLRPSLELRPFRA